MFYILVLGRLRPQAVTTSQHVPALPNVPTVAESGFAGFDAPAWWAILAPAKTPPGVLKRMNEEVNKALNPEIAKKLSAQGIDILGGTPESARDFIEADRHLGRGGEGQRDLGGLNAWCT